MMEHKVDKLNLPNMYICGEQGTGKTYIANYLTTNFPGYKSVKISEPLYKMCSLIRKDNYGEIAEVLMELGFDRHTTWHMRGEISSSIIEDVHTNSKPRFALQMLGDIVRKYNEDALIERVLEISKIQPIIIEDVRLVKEGEFFRENGFIGIRISADEEVREKRLIARDGVYNKSTKKHKTESGIDKVPYDYLIENNDENMDKLYNKLFSIVLKHS